MLSSASAGFENDPGDEFHRAAERAVEDSGPEWTQVRPGMCAGNLLDWSDAIRAEGVAKAPYDAARQSPVHELDIAAVAATALLSDGHNGKIYTLSGPEALTKTEQVAAIGKAIGRDIRFEELTSEQWREHVKEEMPPFVIDWLLGLWAQTVDNPDPCCRPSRKSSAGRRGRWPNGQRTTRRPSCGVRARRRPQRPDAAPAAAASRRGTAGPSGAGIDGRGHRC